MNSNSLNLLRVIFTALGSALMIVSINFAVASKWKGSFISFIFSFLLNQIILFNSELERYFKNKKNTDKSVE